MKAWLIAGAVCSLSGFTLGLVASKQQNREAALQSSLYQRGLATCRYVLASCVRGEDLSGLTDAARASCGLPAAKVRP